MDGSSRRTKLQAGGLLLAGAVAGGVLAATVAASATSPGATHPSPASYAAGPGAGGPGAGGPGPDSMRPHLPLALSGTVTSVGPASVSIHTSSGTKTYAVDAQSDIDKNGEAKLSDLVSGDKVRFAVRPGTSTIAVLHTGDESKNMPPMGPGGMGPGGMGPGGRHHDGPWGDGHPSAAPTTSG